MIQILVPCVDLGHLLDVLFGIAALPLAWVTYPKWSQYHSWYGRMMSLIRYSGWLVFIPVPSLFCFKHWWPCLHEIVADANLCGILATVNKSEGWKEPSHNLWSASNLFDGLRTFCCVMSSVWIHYPLPCELLRATHRILPLSISSSWLRRRDIMPHGPK